MVQEEHGLRVRQEHLKGGAIPAPDQCALAAWRSAQHARILDICLCRPTSFLAPVHAQQLELLVLQAHGHAPHHTSKLWKSVLLYSGDVT